MEDQRTNSHTAANNNSNNKNNNANSITTSSSSSSRCSGSSTVASSREKSNTSEPVRSRWTPKPEQILILESIFNSGMVNPPKEETVRIRKLLEKFGAVGDANVFYWFQNRRSRSRRRQRQLQASLAASAAATTITNTNNLVSAGGSLLDNGGMQFYEFGNNNHNTTTCIATSPIVATSLGTSGFNAGVVDDAFTTLSAQMGVITSHQLDSRNSSSNTQTICHNDASHLEFPTGIITVFINGVATQAPEGPIDVKTMFGEEVLLVHTSGAPVPFNGYGITAQSLQHGESYFLVPRLT